jgi:hypothetical protein
LLEEIGYTIPDDSESVDAYLKDLREHYPDLREPRVPRLDDVLASCDLGSAAPEIRQSWVKLARFFPDPKALEETLWIIPRLPNKWPRRTVVFAPGTKRTLGSLSKHLRKLAARLEKVILGRTLLPEPLMSEAPSDLRHLPRAMMAASEFLKKLDNPHRLPSAPRTVALRVLLDWVKRRTGSCHFADVARLLDAAFYAVKGSSGPGEDALKTLWHKKHLRTQSPPKHKNPLRTTSG